MQTQFENPEATKLNNETTSSASPRMRMICVAEKAAEKSTVPQQHSGMGYNKLVSKYLTSRGLQSRL